MACSYKIKQAKKHMYLLKNSLGKLWGPSSTLMKWIWKAVVALAITYGCFVWNYNLKSSLIDKLAKLQRFALTLMDHFRKGTPATGLDVIMGITPIDLELSRLAKEARLRLAPRLIRDWNGKGPGQHGHLGHIKIADLLLEQIGITEGCLDVIPNQSNRTEGYKILGKTHSQEMISNPLVTATTQMVATLKEIRAMVVCFTLRRKRYQLSKGF